VCCSLNQKISDFKKKFDGIANDSLKFCCAALAREFQASAADTLDALKEEATGLKTESISADDEDSANTMLGFEMAIDAIRNELQMWISLKDDDPDSAWGHLVDAQMATFDTMGAHPLFSYFDGYSRRLGILEKMLFPPQTFVSPGSTAKSLQCSICGKESGECDHLPGKAYMGKFCNSIVRGLEFKELSIVADPGSKHHRVTAYSIGGQMRNVMTWRTEEETPPTSSA